MTTAPSRPTLYGVALICFANLLLEVVLTRIYSATMFYHFTFLAIAMALFGLGASGVYVYVREEELARAPLARELARNARRFAAATVLLVIYVLANPMDIVIVTGTSQTPMLTKKAILQLLLLVGFSSLPFFYSGLVVSLAVTRWREQINRVYFFDLVGAALAALLAGVLLGWFGGPSLVIAIALIAVVGAALFEVGRARWVPVAGVGALLAFNLWSSFIAVPTVKGVKADTVRFEGWNVFSRVTVDDTYNIKIDASASTAITSKAKIAATRPAGEISSLAHALFPDGAERVLVIGPGGGRDVVHALSAGAKHVTGVEINPLIAKTIMQERFVGQSGGLYGDPRVKVVVADGRSYVRAASERFDVIQASLVDTWAATAAGAFALTENTLYTVEAFEDYYRHLTPDGVITMTRWHSGDGGETARLLLLATGTLERLGVPAGQTRKHIFYATKDNLGTLVAKRGELTEEELGRLDEAATQGGFQVVVSPFSEPATNRLAAMIDAGAWSQAVAAEREELRPPSDDRPFFFYFAKLKDLWRLEGRLDGPMNDPSLWMLISLLTVCVLTVSFILVPLALRGMPRASDGGVGATYRRSLALAYFALLGLAFIVVEMAMLQKLTFFLGHPSYALLVVLFSLLIATAVGARLSGRIADARLGRTLLVVGGLLALLVGVYALVLGPGLRGLVGWSIGARIPLAALLVALPGVLMGMMLPSGIRMLGRRDAELIPWAWGLNGATSVIGTVAATVVAIYVGFAGTLGIGAVGYLLAACGAFELERVSGK
jgi:predicted membrane-bound spermidine synthase